MFYKHLGFTRGKIKKLENVEYLNEMEEVTKRLLVKNFLRQICVLKNFGTQNLEK